MEEKNKELDLSILLVNYKTIVYLIDCVRSIFADMENNNLSFEINILDNNSGDDLSNIADLFSAIKDRGKVNIYFSEKNLGFGGGNNLLAKEAKGKYLLLLNPDIIIQEKNSIERLFNRIEMDPLIKVIGPKLCNNKGKVQLWDHGESHGFLVKFLNEIGLGMWFNRKKETDCAWVSGAVFLIQKATFNKIGRFDERFFLYKEENDLCLRLKRKNRKSKILYFPDVTVLHIGSVVAKKKVFFKESNKFFLKKHRFGERN